MLKLFNQTFFLICWKAVPEALFSIWSRSMQNTTQKEAEWKVKCKMFSQCILATELLWKMLRMGFNGFWMDVGILTYAKTITLQLSYV